MEPRWFCHHDAQAWPCAGVDPLDVGTGSADRAPLHPMAHDGGAGAWRQGESTA